MAALEIPASSVTLVGSCAASTQDSSLRFVDYMILPPAGDTDAFETNDYVTAASLGVKAIRGVLALQSIEAGAAGWAYLDPSSLTTFTDIRSRMGAYASGVTNTIAASSDVDKIILGSDLNGDMAMWIQLLVEV